MKFKPSRTRKISARYPQLPHCCSLVVLASLGALGVTSAAVAQGASGALPGGTLPVLRGVVSGQAVVNAPVQSGGRSRLTVDQASQRAILDWRSFNVSRDAEVLFRQPGSTASTLNRIYDANPSVIQGRISSEGPVVGGRATAGGQIILINQNGILFDRGAQVNTQSLVASTLNLSNSRFLSGALTTGGLTSPAFEGGYDDTGATLEGSTPVGSIRLAGSLPSAADAPRIAANAGGSVMLFAPRIENDAGVITSPDGQVILGAGRKVYLALNEDTNNTTLRGLVVEVEAAPGGPGVNLSSLIRNAGQISADRGNVTLAALAVNQQGRVSAKTAVQANGSIYLKARSQDGTAGSVTLERGSVTEVQPDADDKSTIANSADYTALRGAIEVDGRTIESRGTLRAAGGRIALRAADASDPSAARVYLDAGSETSVAGAWADLPYQSNMLTFRVTSNELKNSPDQKTGLLRGAQVTVDLRQSNAILDLSGYIGAQARTVTEKAAVGGELTIDSTGSVIQRSGATIDASGGGYRYGPGVARTTRLLGDDGRIYDIATAPKDRRYVAQLDSVTRQFDRWGQTVTYANPLGSVGQSELASVQGLAGGTVQINASNGLVLDGAMKGGVTVGARQFSRAPRGATLRLGQFNADQPESSRLIGGVRFASTSSDSLGSDFLVDSLLTGEQGGAVVLSSATLFGTPTATDEGLVDPGFSTVEINSGSVISLPAGVRVDAPVGSSLTLRAPLVDLAGTLHAPAGQIVVPSSPLAPLTPQDIAEPVTRVVVRSGADISTAGAWINNSAADGSFVGGPLPSARVPATGTTPTSTTAGGSISLTAQSLLLERGAVLDVSGGASMDRSGRLSGGSGGSLTLANGLTTASTPDWLQSELRGFGVSNGGQLSITTPRILIEPDNANGTLPSDTTRFGSALFSDMGFAGVRLTSPLGVELTAGTVLQPRQKNLVIDPVQAKTLPTGSALADVASVASLPDATRAPVSVTLAAPSMTTGRSTITVGEGAAIVADPRARISMSAVDGLTMDGILTAPGGEVSLTLNRPINTEGAPLQLGSRAVVSTAGSFVPSVNDRGLLQGAVIGGGSVTLEAVNSGVRLESGSLIDVSGVRRELDVATAGTGAPIARGPVDGPAGSVIVKSQGAVALDGTLRGNSPSATSAGGSLALELRAPDGLSTLPAARRVIVTQNAVAAVEESGFVDAGVAVNTLVAGGFDKLRLQAEDRIEFRGDSNLAFARGVRLDSPLLDVAGDASVAVEGSTVSLGQSLGPRVLSSNTYVISPLDPSPVLATRSGEGQFAVSAQNVDLFGNLTVNGVDRVNVEAQQDVRLVGRAVLGAVADSNGVLPVSQPGFLTTTGNVSFRAAQVYPATRTSFTVSVKDTVAGAVVPDGVVRIASNDNVPGDVYSAAGRLTVEADQIVQGGRLKAPLGEIDLKAGSRLELAAGSLTSVGTDGLTIPYGTTSAGVLWTYRDTSNTTQPSPIDQVSVAGKRVGLSGATVDVQNGATVDLRGGGDVLAVEFVPGSGGDSDITVRDNTFAIVPKSRLTSRPIDTDIALQKDIGFGFGSARQDTALYDSIRIGAGGAVPAGEYALLPARYALLPDAYLVQIQTGPAYSNLRIGDRIALTNGNTVLAGFRTASGTSVSESSSVGVVVRPGLAASQESDFTLTGSQFFADKAARDRTRPAPLPRDAGQLDITRVAALELDGRFLTAAATPPSGSRGEIAKVNISGPRIAVVDQVGDPSVGGDFLQLDSASLSALDASVLLGGVRSNVAGGVAITTEADTIVVANSAQRELRAPELVLAANELIDIREGAALRGAGSVEATAPTALLASPSGALVRLSNGAQTRVDRGASPSALSGDVLVGAGATLAADGSVLVDATRTARSQGSIRAVGTGGSVSLASTRVSLGEVAGLSGSDNGLVLSNADLAGYGALGNLTLKGYGSIDLIGSTTLGATQLGQLVLDTPELRGVSAASSTIEARTVTFTNSTAPATQAAQAGTGSLAVTADRINLGAGDKAVTGFASVRTSASGEIVGQGTGSAAVYADWAMQAQRLRGDSGSVQTWSARGVAAGPEPEYRPLQVEASASPGALAADNSLGARLTLEGQRVNVGSTVQALSGRVAIAARGTDSGDDVTVGALGKVIARGTAKAFNGASALADGGVVSLAAAMGSGRVILEGGSEVDVSAANGPGKAGMLQVAAAELSAQGNLRGTGAGRSGSADIDVSRLASADGFSAINSRLNQGGFAEARSMRVRGGDLTVAATDSVLARDVTLVSDGGTVNVAGRVGSGSTGRSAAVGIHGGGGVVLAAGSLIDASSSQADAYGGDVRISARSGTLEFDRNAVIDVRKGERGQRGSVTFTVQRDAGDVLGANRLEGSVLSKRSAAEQGATVAVEAQRSYEVGSTVSASDVATYAAQHQAFVNNTPAAPVVGGLRGDDGASAGAVLRGATELRSAGDLRIDQPWDLTTPEWLAGGEPGTLSLRAAGNLTISTSVGSVNDNIVAGSTWNLRAVAGADLASADPMAVLSPDRVAADKGDLLLTGANAKLRTGTGDIELAAARDFNIDNVRGAVYTGGRIGVPDAENTETLSFDRWATEGGNIKLIAGRDVLGPASPQGDLWITEWLRRPRQPSATWSADQRTDWWAYRPHFQQGIGTLAGGNIDVVAGRDVNQLAAMLPTTGRTYRDQADVRQVDVQGGGDLRLTAGNDVNGGAFLVGRGAGTIDAAGDIGASRAIQLYVMGASSGGVAAQSSLDVAAGGELRLQSINNPTVLAQFDLASVNNQTPSFGSGSIPNFFTYSPNSSARLSAKGGDVSLEPFIQTQARTLSNTSVGSVQRSGSQALPAFPANLSVVAYNGSVVRNQSVVPLVTFPSPTAQVKILASDSISWLQLTGSDRNPATVSTPTTLQPGTLQSPNQVLAGNALLASGQQSRILERQTGSDLAFDIQALNGSITDAGLNLPAASRVRAGEDILRASLTLQNLRNTDVSVVRADEGDFRDPVGVEIRGPGRLLIQAGRDVDMGQASVRLGEAFPGGVLATGSNANPNLPTADSARITLVAGVKGEVGLARLDGAYGEIIALNSLSTLAQELHAQLAGESNQDRVLEARTIAELAAADSAYQRFVSLDRDAPRLLTAYQNSARGGSLPLGPTADASAARALYALLNTEPDTQKLVNAGSLANLATTSGSSAFSAFLGLDARYPRLFKDYVQRRTNGAQPTSIVPILFSDTLAEVVAEVVRPQDVAAGNILSFNTSIQTFGGSDIDMLAPGGNIVVGLTTPRANTTIGVLTNSGGAIRSVVSGNFDINQGKVLTAQGGDILILSTQGSIDAGRGAKTSLSTPPPTRTPIFTTVDGESVIVGFLYTLPTSAAGSGIQTLTSDPDGAGPRSAPGPGSVYLFAPAGSIDAGEAGIRSSGNIVLNAQVVRNATNISSAGSSVGVPVATAGSLASSVATSGSNTQSAGNAADEAGKAAAAAAKAASADGMQKPAILTVEVLGFGDKNCKEQDKDCFAK